MAELADAPDLGSGSSRNAGSTPVTRTKTKRHSVGVPLRFGLSNGRVEPVQVAGSMKAKDLRVQLAAETRSVEEGDPCYPHQKRLVSTSRF